MAYSEADKRMAFHKYKSLGGHRSYRKVAAALDIHQSTVAKWAREDNWDTRVESLDAAENLPQAKEIGAVTALTTLDTSVETMLSRAVCAMDSLFVDTGDGGYRFAFPVQDVEEFQTLVRSMKDLADVRIKINSFVEAETGKKKQEAHSGKIAETLNTMMVNMTPEQMMQFMGGGELPQDAEYTITEAGVEEGDEEADNQSLPHTENTDN